MYPIVLLGIWGHLSYFLYDFKLYIILLVLAFFSFIFFSAKVYNSNRSQKKKKYLIAILFAILIFIIFYSLFEAYFRYRYDESDGLGFLDTNVRWMGRHVVFNTYGYRDRDFKLEKTPGVLRIGVIGDSLTMGYGIKNVNNRFSNVLEKKLNDHGIRAEVFNIGESGLDTCSEIHEFDRVKQLNFDLMVWEYYPNDIQPCHGRSTGSQIISIRFNTINPVLKIFLDQSFFFNFVYWKLSPTYGNTFRDLRIADLTQFSNPPVLKMHFDDIASMSAIMQQNTSRHKVVVIIFPYLFLLGKNYPASGIHGMISEDLKKNGNYVIDLMPYLINTKNVKLMVNNFDSHPNEYVHALAAQLLYDKIVQILQTKK